MKSFLAGVFIGAAAAGLVVGSNLYKKQENVSGRMTTLQISGEKITQKDFSLSGPSIKFRTEAKGKGVAETEIPKRLIPEARDWMDRVHGVQGGIGLIYDGRPKAIYSAGYAHRWGSFSLGVTVLGGVGFMGGELRGGYWF